MVLNSKRIVVLASGSGSNLQSIINAINNGDINGSIVAVISNRKMAYALKRAQHEGIEGLYIGKGNFPDDNERGEALFVKLKEINPDLIVLAGYLEIIPKSVIDAFKNRIMNVHPALIPSFCGDGYYGMNVHRAVVEYGVKITGATVHFVDEGTDTGPVILQDTVSVKDTDTAEEVQKNVLEIEHELLPEAVKLFCDDKISVKGRIVNIGGQ